MPSQAVRLATPLRLVRPGELPPEVVRARAERSGRRVLTALWSSVGALTVVGLVMVLSASSVSAFADYGSSFLFFKRQLVYACLGGALALLASRLRYHVWQRAWGPLLGLSIALLLLVMHPSFGVQAGGASRWIALGSFSFQPSELAKLAVAAGTASILAKNLRYLDDPVVWLLPLVPLVGVVTVLILLQPDLGTAMLIVLTVFLSLFVAGARLRLLLAGALACGALGTALIFVEGYRRTRLLAFLDPWADPKNAGYQILQSLIALGSGHLFGVGLGASRQKWRYVPNAHTDFIFSIMGEELGLLGELVVLALLGTLLYAGVRIALAAPDAFGRLLASGITAWFGVQSLINLGAVTGILPITGVPLPFLSFGGSSLVVSLSAVGILASVARGPSRRAPPRRGSGGMASRSRDRRRG